MFLQLLNKSALMYVLQTTHNNGVASEHTVLHTTHSPKPLHISHFTQEMMVKALTSVVFSSGLRPQSDYVCM